MPMTELRAEAGLAAGVGRAYNPGMQDTATRSEPKFTSMGFEVTKTFTVNESEPIDGAIREYELVVDDKLAWTGMGDDRADGGLFTPSGRSAAQQRLRWWYQRSQSGDGNRCA
jgi:hypothetical protein